MGLLPGQILPTNTLMARTALAPSAPTNMAFRATPPPPATGTGSRLADTVVRGISSNVVKEATATSVPSVSSDPSVGSAGSAGNAGNIGGAAGNRSYDVTGISLPLLGQVNPIWLAAGAAVVLFLVLKD